MALAMLVAGCGGGSSDDGGTASPTTVGGAETQAKQGGVFRQPISEPAFIDPFNAQESNGNRVIKRLFVGLTTFDGNPELLMRPGVAETWSPDDTCTQWTFNLRRSTFSNGEEVTADSFIRGWTRAADGRAESQVAGHLAGIQGYGELRGAPGSPPTATTFAGLSAPKPQTLVVALGAPDCEFDKKTIHSVMSPVPSAAGAYDNKEFNEAPIGNGPFKIKPGTKWEHDRGISVVRNDSYFGPKPNIDGIEFVILPAQGPPTAQYSAFEAGELDVAAPPSGTRAAAEAEYGPTGGFLSQLPYATSFIGMNVSSGPLREPDARRALSLSLDRTAISKAVGEGYWQAASALIPPPFGTYHQPGICDACRFDPAAAADLAARGGLTSATRLRFLVNSASNPALVAYKDQIEKALGIGVDLEALPLPEALARQAAGEYDLISLTWGADYPTTDNILFPLLGRGSAENAGKYDDAEFNDLIGQARAQRDNAERRRLLQRAEQIAIGRDVALAPTFYVPTLLVFDATKWSGVGLDFFGDVSFQTMSLE
ncbi:MAG TPA: ABC transporter substrate-binding protein [Acidimicrobiales bacterium]|nr:ABC transporter substrate-binding protein [Acidimicrobiales bacterium]